jgi:hypothetical protein
VYVCVCVCVCTHTSHPHQHPHPRKMPPRERERERERERGHFTTSTCAESCSSSSETSRPLSSSPELSQADLLAPRPWFVELAPPPPPSAEKADLECAASGWCSRCGSERWREERALESVEESVVESVEGSELESVEGSEGVLHTVCTDSVFRVLFEVSGRRGLGNIGLRAEKGEVAKTAVAGVLRRPAEALLLLQDPPAARSDKAFVTNFSVTDPCSVNSVPAVALALVAVAAAAVSSVNMESTVCCLLDRQPIHVPSQDSPVSRINLQDQHKKCPTRQLHTPNNFLSPLITRQPADKSAPHYK